MIEFMRIILSVIFAIFFTSCAIPTSYKLTSNELQGLNCLEADDVYYLSRLVDTCPLLSLKPSPKSNSWELRLYDQFGQNYVEESKKFNYKLKIRSCNLPTLISDNIVLSQDSKFFLESAHTRSDTFASNRLFLKGTVHVGNENIQWRHEVGLNQERDIRKRILSQFKICGK